MLINHDHLRAVVRAITTAGGSTGDEPNGVANNLVNANLTGHDSHGVGMLPRYIEAVASGQLIPNQRLKMVSDAGAMLVVDGGAGYGQMIGEEAMKIGIERAETHGVCVLSIRQSFHLCRIGAWGEQCADAGMISMHHVNVTGHLGLVAPHRGGDARFATNPYCCVMPATKNNPHTVLDMATSVVAHGKVRVARNKGEEMKPGILIDGEGRPTTDPNAMFTTPPGAILPFAEHKGYGLALINELLAGVLSAGGTCRPELERDADTILNNMLSIIIDPSRLVSKEDYDAEMDAYIEYVKASPPQDPALPVLVPGDPERLSSAERRANGIPIDDTTWAEIVAAAQSVGIGAQRINAIATGA
ncbi:MAG: malate/lactate/ureidoglycolate dehydrogenase [Chromatiales bacterium]|jgi:hydroxycarboxylate dehydrogenase B|nr:malate/lactate/ureidoglycolate dehydrogenase [Chromatiales bacterium]